MSQWDGIDEFIAVATTGSFSRAAKAIRMSPTHVSRAIIALEQRVQAQLFFRTTRTVRLTDTGRVFFERCAHIAQERDEAIALIGEQGEPQGELRVTCSTAMGERFVAPIIRRFAMHHPRLNVTIDLSNRVVDLVGEGYDLGIRTCAAPSYLARAGKPARVDQLAAHELIVGSSDAWHFRVGDQDVAHYPRGRFRCNSGHAVMEACISGLGICQLPDFYILPYLRHGMVDLILTDCQPADEPIWAVYPQRQHLSPKVRAVVEILELELSSVINARA
jgi:DNA-binding transcriptional LysR family regulator